MDAELKRKVTVKLTYNDSTNDARPSSRTNILRPPSPLKLQASSLSSEVTSTFRPRAKINSSATPASATRKSPSVLSTSSRSSALGGSNISSASASSTPRALSPAKPAPRIRNGALSPTLQPKIRTTVVRSTLRPQSAQSTSTTATISHRDRSRTTTASDTSPNDISRTRQGSVSLHHASSFSSLISSTPPSRSGSPTMPRHAFVAGSDQEGSSLAQGSLRVKAKVTGMAKVNGDSLFPIQPLNAFKRPGSPRTRASSVSSSASMSSAGPTPQTPQSVFYPITTATSAANPHRFATTRGSPPPAHHSYQPFLPPRNDLHGIYTRHQAVPMVDPITIPLPPHSPPTSSVSFSSRSSVSHSSVSQVAGSADSQSSVSTHQNGFSKRQTPDSSLQSTLDNLITYSAISHREENYSGDSDQDQDTDPEKGSDDRKVKATAKSNRKIADLEITNRSLLAINASLETTKHRQAQEIRELKRKLRESRLILPPRAYRAYKSSMDPAEQPDDEDDDEDEDEDDDDNDELEPKVEANDEAYNRIRSLLDGLLVSGKRALESKVEDHPDTGKAVAKVLTAEEVRNWRDSSGGHGSDHEGDISIVIPLSPSHVAVPDSDFESEDEVLAMTLPRASSTTPSSPAPPPILITESA